MQAPDKGTLTSLQTPVKLETFRPVAYLMEVERRRRRQVDEGYGLQNRRAGNTGAAFSKPLTENLTVPPSNATPCRCSHDADLRAVLDAWPTLPAAIKAGILAMVKATKGT